MDLFAGLKSFLKTDATNLDNYVFRLHYKFTSAILLAFSLLVTARQYVGDPIDCISQNEKLDGKLLDTFCWIHTTFSMPLAWKMEVGDEVPYPGVYKNTKDAKKIYHAYYQWVCFVLFLQAILFYIPRYFWKAMEGGKVKNLSLGLNSPILTEDTRKNNRALLVDYIVSNLNNHNCYFMHFAFAEIMNFANVVGQIYLTDAFLGGEFLRYGINVVQFTDWDWSVKFDPMIKVFPRVAKCVFYKYGPSGQVTREDALCSLSVNIINEKIYLFLWFWFVILTVLSGLVLVYRALIVFWPKSRLMVIRYRARVTDESYLEDVVNKCHLGDWLLLNLLCKNLEPLNFRDVIADTARRMEGKQLDFI